MTVSLHYRPAVRRTSLPFPFFCSLATIVRDLSLLNLYIKNSLPRFHGLLYLFCTLFPRVTYQHDTVGASLPRQGILFQLFPMAAC